MIDGLIHGLVFPVPPKFAVLPAVGKGEGDGERHDVMTANNYRIPLLHYPRPGAGSGAGPGPGSGPVQRVLVVSHGNATDLAQMADTLKSFRDMFGVAVIGYEYIGYNHTCRVVPVTQESSCCSKSDYCGEEGAGDAGDAGDGSRIIPDEEIIPSEAKCYESIVAAHKYITETLGYSEEQQLWMGISIGGGPTVDLLSRLATKPVAGMILVSPFYSATSVVSEALSYVWDIFPNYSKIKRVQAPTLILHGSHDEVIPVDHSARLERCYRGTRLTRKVIQYAGHNDMFMYPETIEHLKNFIYQN